MKLLVAKPLFLSVALFNGGIILDNTIYFSVGIFGVMAILFGYISFSVLIRKKPVAISSKWLFVLISLSSLPAIVLNTLSYRSDNDAGLFQLLAPAMYVFLIAFYAVILKGFSIYGISDNDFRKFILQSLSNLNVKATEKMNKLVLDEVGTEIAVSFQEWMGTGMVRSKNTKKFDIRLLKNEFNRLLRDNVVETKRVTAYFYIGFSLLMLAASFGLAWLMIFGQR